MVGSPVHGGTVRSEEEEKAEEDWLDDIKQAKRSVIELSRVIPYGVKIRALYIEVVVQGL